MIAYQLPQLCTRLFHPVIPILRFLGTLQKNANILRHRQRRQVTLLTDIRFHTCHLGSWFTQAETVHVRIPVGSHFKTRHGHERVLLRMRDDCGHHDSHKQLGARRKHVRNEVRIIAREQEAFLPVSSLSRSHGCVTQRALRVHPLHVISRVVLAVHRPPHGRVPAQTNVVWNTDALRSEKAPPH